MAAPRQCGLRPHQRRDPRLCRIRGAAVRSTFSGQAVPPLQWGDSPTWESGSGIQLLWQDEDVEAGWTVEYRPGAAAASPSGAEWLKADPPVMRRIAVQNVPPHRLCRVSLKGLV